LLLFKNNISNIEALKKVKFGKLENLNLSHNNISDINVLQNANFKQLKNLDLTGNKISDIKVLLEFKELEILKLTVSK